MSSNIYEGGNNGEKREYTPLQKKNGPYLTKDDLDRITGKPENEEPEEKKAGLEDKVDNLVKKGESAVGKGVSAGVYIGTWSVLFGARFGAPGAAFGAAFGTYCYLKRKTKQKVVKDKKMDRKEGGTENGKGEN